MNNSAAATEYNAVSALESFTPPLGVTDSEIDDAVAQMGMLPLLMSVVHITGRLDILHEAGRTERPQHSADLSGSLAPERTATLRQSAAQAIRAWRDSGFPAPYAPGEDELRSMIDTLAGQALDPRYEKLAAEELGFKGDERAMDWGTTVPDAAKARLPALIAGAGLAGIAMGYRLKQAGIPFTIVEKNSGPGGTWFENRFPGARVDVPSHCYSFSFVRDFRWPELFSPSPVLRTYFLDVVERLGLKPHIRYETSVVSATYDEQAAAWDVVLRNAEGESTQRFGAFISAVGQLNRPLIPKIEGEEIFKGVRVHTSRWRDDLSVSGKKVIVIGTAATALQIVPELAREASHLTVFQRSPVWAAVYPLYRNAVSPGEQWAIDHLPGYARWYRLILYNFAMDTTPAHMQIDPDWTGGPQAVSAPNEAMRIRLTESMRGAIGDSEDLAAKLIPTYPPFVKRANLCDGGYYRAFSRPNVSLCTEGVARFVEDGIIDGAGQHHQADIVVYATGFRAHEFLAPMEITGIGGQRIDQYWGEEPRAYLGITVPNFPNLFMMYGPGTNLGFNGNLFFNAECQAHYISGCLKWMLQENLASIDVKPKIYTEYANRVDGALAKFAWSLGSATSWYKNKAGKVITNTPWPMLNYWEWTRAPNPTDFITTPAKVLVT